MGSGETECRNVRRLGNHRDDPERAFPRPPYVRRMCVGSRRRPGLRRDDRPRCRAPAPSRWRTAAAAASAALRQRRQECFRPPHLVEIQRHHRPGEADEDCHTDHVEPREAEGPTRRFRCRDRLQRHLAPEPVERDVARRTALCESAAGPGPAVELRKSLANLRTGLLHGGVIVCRRCRRQTLDPRQHQRGAGLHAFVRQTLELCARFRRQLRHRHQRGVDGLRRDRGQARHHLAHLAARLAWRCRKD